ncbi:MAG: hypothetical protein ACHQAY_11520 [Hyphomicrobiales bacterium]
MATQTDDALEPALFRLTGSHGLRWLTSVAAAIITAAWVFDTTAGAAQRLAWLMERARPACLHGGITNEELHDLAARELETSTSKKDALRSVVALCQAKLRTG